MTAAEYVDRVTRLGRAELDVLDRVIARESNRKRRAQLVAARDAAADEVAQLEVARRAGLLDGMSAEQLAARLVDA